MASSSMTAVMKYTYTPLDSPSQSIRLVALKPSSASNTIECELHTVALASPPSYVALSYTWGSPEDLVPVHIDDKEFSVSKNLWKFLATIRHDGRWRLFWIDAICINQKDFEERHTQVSIMRQIYATAENVFVWLGTSIPSSDLAMDYIAQRTFATNNLKPSHKISSYHQIWEYKEGEAVLDICQRGYWTRAWIVQEIIYAKRILVFCGSKSVPWEKLGYVFQSLKAIQLHGWFRRHSHGSEVLASPAAAIFWQKGQWDKDPTLKEKGSPLIILLESYERLESTRPVDKVYSLLGLSSDIIPIDYRKPIEEVYNDVMRVCIPLCRSRAAKDRFAHLLLRVLRLSEGNSKVFTVEDFMSKPVKAKNKSVVLNIESYRVAQPTTGEAEVERSMAPFPRALGRPRGDSVSYHTLDTNSSLTPEPRASIANSLYQPVLLNSPYIVAENARAQLQPNDFIQGAPEDGWYR